MKNIIMKRLILPILLFFAFNNVNAQSSYDVAKYLDSDLVGTARYVSMGGSMSALGSDISVMGVNPAGIGLYRSGVDASVTFGLTSMNTEADCLGNKESMDKTRFSIDNAGFVLSNHVDNGIVQYVNLGFNYKHRNNLKREFLMAGATDGFSQMYQMQRLYDAASFNILEMSYYDYVSLSYSWLALLAADGGLLSGESYPQGVIYPNTTSMIYNSEEEGGVDQIDCNISCNIDDRFYLGLTVGLYNVDYTRNSYYGEDDDDGPLYTMYNQYATEGSGVDIKLGAIVRPFVESPFRIGFAVHSPTWYSLTDRMSAAIEGVGFDGAPYGGYMSTADYEYAYGGDFIVDYRLTTPWRFNVSTAYTFGTTLAVNAEYEYSDYTTAKMEYSGGAKMGAINDELESNMKEVHTFKLGAELKLDNNLSLRGGYNYISAPYKQNAAKVMIPATDTNTEYFNSKEQSNYTLGIGYRGKMFYLDAAYVLSVRKGDFYPFYDTIEYEYKTIYNHATTVKDVKNRFIVTAGIRF